MRQIYPGGIRFSRQEINQLFKSFIFISLAFTIATSKFDTGFIWIFLYSAVAVGLGFILHELAHKFFAQRYGCWSEFRSNDGMLWLALLISFTGFIFIAPGAVVIRGSLTRKENGIVSAAGPSANIILAIIFFLLSMVYPIKLFSYGVSINSWIALFNLIPVIPFDGMKIFRWNKKAYLSLLAVSLIFMLI